MKRYALLSLILIPISLVIVSCEKEGPQGPAGPQGATGPAGATGSQGAVGTANVIYSAWQLSGSANWVANVFATSGSQDARYMYGRTASGITTTVMNQGVVLCYMRNTGGPLGFQFNYVFQLPYTYITNTDVDHYDYSIPAAGGQIYFLYKTASVPLTTSALGFLEYRYVIIPGGVSGGRMMSGSAVGYTADQLKAMPYDQVLSKFNIPPDGSNQ